MSTKSDSALPADATLAEVWKIKQENAAEHGYDIDAIAAAARKHQESHRHRVVTRDADPKK